MYQGGNHCRNHSSETRPVNGQLFVDDVDFLAAAVLREGYKAPYERGVRLVLAKASDELRIMLDRSDVTVAIAASWRAIATHITRKIVGMGSYALAGPG